MGHILMVILAFFMLVFIFKNLIASICIISLCTIGIYLWCIYKKKASLHEARQKLRFLVKTHHLQLASSRRNGIHRDKNGMVIDYKAWNDSCQRFVDEIYRPVINADEIDAILQYGLEKLASEEIEAPLAREQKFN